MGMVEGEREMGAANQIHKLLGEHFFARQQHVTLIVMWRNSHLKRTHDFFCGNEADRARFAGQ